MQLLQGVNLTDYVALRGLYQTYCRKVYLADMKIVSVIVERRNKRTYQFTLIDEVHTKALTKAHTYTNTYTF